MLRVILSRRISYCSNWKKAGKETVDSKLDLLRNLAYVLHAPLSSEFR